MILWDHNGKPVDCDSKDLTPGVLDMISGISDSFERGACPFCNRGYTQELSCHHLHNILVVEGDAYWHRAFIGLPDFHIISVSTDDGLPGPELQQCETCKSSHQKIGMIHVHFAADDDSRIRIVSYCSDECASHHWLLELKRIRDRQSVQQWIKDGCAQAHI